MVPTLKDMPVAVGGKQLAEARALSPFVESQSPPFQVFFRALRHILGPMVIRGAATTTYPPKGFELPSKPVPDSDPWQGYLDLLEMQGRPPLVQNEFHLAYTRLTERQFTAQQLAAQLAAQNPAEPLPDTMKDWQRVCWGRPSWQHRPAYWGGGWNGGYGRHHYGHGHRC